MDYWFNKKYKINGEKYYSKSISLNFYPNHFCKFHISNNGAVKGNHKHTCYDLNIHFFLVFFSFTNWDYNCKK